VFADSSKLKHIFSALLDKWKLKHQGSLTFECTSIVFLLLISLCFLRLDLYTIWVVCISIWEEAEKLLVASKVAFIVKPTFNFQFPERFNVKTMVKQVAKTFYDLLCYSQLCRENVRHYNKAFAAKCRF
jgi:hypothetical protein